MTIIAKTVKGQEFVYNARSARKVSARSANTICKIVNEHKALLGTKENEVWRVYNIDKYSKAYDFAQTQSFTIRNGVVTARHY